ncbi:unnamed protein product, partial [Didymodactylos carnosus]
MTSLLEHLPNEILLDIFQYLSPRILFQCIYNLNFRFNQLIHVLKVPIDIGNILSKRLFNQYCTCVIPKCLSQIISLKLSDTYDRITQFQKLFQIDLYINLRLLVMRDPTQDNLQLILEKLSKLKYLEQLQIISLGRDKLDLRQCSKILVESIFCNYEMIKLRLVKLAFYDSILLEGIQISNIEYLNMSGCYINEFVILLKHLPKLKRLIIHVYNRRNFDDPIDYQIYENIGQYVPYLTNLELNVTHTQFDETEQLLKNIPQLKKLAFSAMLISYADGIRWEKLIVSFLPLLEQFSLDIADTRFRANINLNN